MKKTVLAIVCALPLSVMLVSGQAPRAAATGKQTSTAKAQPTASPKATVDRYCVGCHNDKLKTANLTLENFDFAHIADHADKAELVIRKVRAGLMPPNGMPRQIGRAHV